MIERIYFYSIIFSQKMGSEKHTADVVVPDGLELDLPLSCSDGFSLRFKQGCSNGLAYMTLLFPPPLFEGASLVIMTDDGSSPCMSFSSHSSIVPGGLELDLPLGYSDKFLLGFGRGHSDRLAYVTLLSPLLSFNGASLIITTDD